MSLWLLFCRVRWNSSWLGVMKFGLRFFCIRVKISLKSLILFYLFFVDKKNNVHIMKPQKAHVAINIRLS